LSDTGPRGSSAAGAGTQRGSLRALLEEQGGLIAEMLASPAGTLVEVAGEAERQPSELARAAAAGPRTRARWSEYELLIEAIYEGYLLHYGIPRVLPVRDLDLGLLAGDRLYALGLARLVALGDLDGVAELADVITLAALAHGSGRPELAGVVWAAGVRAVGWGPSAAHARAKALARAGDPEALEAMRACAVPA